MRLPGHFGDEAHAKARIGIGAAERVDHKQTLAGKLFGHAGLQLLPGLLRQRLVVVFACSLIVPPQRVAGGVVADDIFILRRATGKNAGIDRHCAALRQGAARITFQLGTEFFGKQRIEIGVVDHFGGALDAQSGKILRGQAGNAHVTAP